MNMFTTVAIIKPMSAIYSILPIELRSVLVTAPYKDIAPNVPALMKNVVAIDDVVYMRNILDKVTPLSTE